MKTFLYLLLGCAQLFSTTVFAQTDSREFSIKKAEAFLNMSRQQLIPILTQQHYQFEEQDEGYEFYKRITPLQVFSVGFKINKDKKITVFSWGETPDVLPGIKEELKKAAFRLTDTKKDIGKTLYIYLSKNNNTRLEIISTPALKPISLIMSDTREQIFRATDITTH
ncbi:hypothetical protein [Chitinophaga sp. Cy-1792]|uniref:hypothetical protein n=1 Tax=Chitinophaga sp. Cy-1792 TaxID=2608339 RepID=UPI0014230CA9|nr:hypothetical protein [Chitinophaga sp. Cy-1792]NIG54423.1 hypothetical protein [Chitinophaga sp. Cy-1792]